MSSTEIELIILGLVCLAALIPYSTVIAHNVSGAYFAQKLRYHKNVLADLGDFHKATTEQRNELK